MKDLKIQQEQEQDWGRVSQVIKAAFMEVAISDQTEHLLVNRLRQSDAFIPELSLIAKQGDYLLGHIMLTKVHIQDGTQQYDSLALAPVSVLPTYQGQGIGRNLIQSAHDAAKLHGYTSIVLIGHETYYPRFGYETASKHGIRFPFDVPDQNCMVKELIQGSLASIQGMVVYPDVFFS